MVAGLRIIIHDDETFEPITIVEMYHWHELGLHVGEHIVVPIMPKITPILRTMSEPVEANFTIRTITIRFEELRRRNRMYWIGITNDPETALLLRATFLPGQRWALNDIKREEFAKGVLATLEAFRG